MDSTTMASRESSPDGASSTTSSPQLTPRSKVKAMLAALDSGSEDDEAPSKSAREKLVESLAARTSTATNETPKTFTKTPDTSENVPIDGPMDDAEDEEDDDIVRPRGRLAAAMLGRGHSPEEDDSAKSDAEDARERVKKMLMFRRKSPEALEDGETGEADDEEDEVPVVRRRRIGRSRPSTPTVSQNEISHSRSESVSSLKAKSPTPAGDASDSDDLPAIAPTSKDRFKALVEKKRQERLAREAEVAEQKAKALLQRKIQAALLEDDEDDFGDDNVERRLTQQQKPTRKASKRAIDEIHKETQRLSRNQQLAHKAITKKKITKSSLFAKFNYKPAGFTEEEEQSRPLSSSSAHYSHSDAKDTPPTSPASHTSKFVHNAVDVGKLGEQEHEDEELPTLEDAFAQMHSSPPSRIDKGKGKAIEEFKSEPEMFEQKTAITKRAIRVRPSMISAKPLVLDDSDSDLEILSKTPRRKKLDAIFDNIPAKHAKEPHSIHTLRMLAHLKSPGKENSGRALKGSMTTTQLQMSLQQRARQQATREREERLQALRDKGVIVQTAEEREKENAEVEDLLAKARQDDEELSKREKAAAKKRKERDGSKAVDDSSGDEDWEEEKETFAEQLSGSEEEEEFDGEENDASGEEEEEDRENLGSDDEELATGVPANQAIDNEAVESDEDEAQYKLLPERAVSGEEETEVGEDDEDIFLHREQRRSRKTNVISDDEDEDPKPSKETPLPPKFESPLQPRTDSPLAPNSVLRSATKTFIPGLTVAGPAGLGLTQIFAGTMDSQMAISQGSPMPPSRYTQPLDTAQDSFAFLRRLPPPEMLTSAPTIEEDTQDVVVNSQADAETQLRDSETQGIQLDYSQSQIHGFDSLLQESIPSQFQEFTQDMGFQHMTPIRGRFAEPPPSTVDTVLLEPEAVLAKVEETPIIKKKGRLRQRAHVVSFSDDEEMADPVEEGAQTDEREASPNAFDVMRQATKKPKAVVDAFDKKHSKAKEMVNEQAEESEDEYAGLGGASDDESGGEADDYVKEMIDDEGGQNVDEHKLAAFFADRERANDEKQVEKLYKDITKGMLRRKRGADYDLSDSDDGGEARRQRKRKEFAKMRKALLADERLGKIAENPKRQAFLRAIEDRGSEDEMDFLEDAVEQDQGSDSQSQNQIDGSQQRVPDSQPPVVMGPPKRKFSDDTADAGNRPPPQLRRTQASKKPSSLAEIRESLSSLIEDPDSITSPLDAGSESDNELEIEDEEDVGSSKDKEKENRDPFARRKTSVPVVDRISLKRALSNDVSTNTRLAFASASSTSGFKVPPLLRRVTTNSSISSTTSSTSSVSGGMSATERMAGGAGSDGVKRGGGKNSGVHYFARESERRAAVLKTEKQREKKRFKGAETRRKAVGGLFGGGKFE